MERGGGAALLCFLSGYSGFLSGYSGFCNDEGSGFSLYFEVKQTGCRPKIYIRFLSGYFENHKET